jgi:C1A family cysteine protease
MGYLRDLPDVRDYVPETKAVAAILQGAGPLKVSPTGPPAKVDLRQWCSPIEDQGSLGSCTAHAGVGLLEFYERLVHNNKHIDASRLFLYKVTRNLLGWTGDTGAYLRTTLKAMTLFGIPPEMHWKYDISKYDVEPSAFLYSFGQSYQSLRYYRHDPAGADPLKTLVSVKAALASSRPSMFGFTVYSSIPSPGDGKVDIPYPQGGEGLRGGHAVVAVGYDDNRQIGDCKGALLIRNSWGTTWGDQGYGWLPYAYVERGLANDFWSLVRAQFVDTDEFE